MFCENTLFLFFFSKSTNIFSPRKKSPSHDFLLLEPALESWGAEGVLTDRKRCPQPLSAILRGRSCRQCRNFRQICRNFRRFASPKTVVSPRGVGWYIAMRAGTPKPTGSGLSSMHVVEPQRLVERFYVASIRYSPSPSRAKRRGAGRSLILLTYWEPAFGSAPSAR